VKTCSRPPRGSSKDEKDLLNIAKSLALRHQNGEQKRDYDGLFLDFIFWWLLAAIEVTNAVPTLELTDVVDGLDSWIEESHMSERVWSEKDLVRRAKPRLAVIQHAEEASPHLSDLQKCCEWRPLR
jgi:hypothetical protein